MTMIREIDNQNAFDVCELTTTQSGIGTIMEDYLCCNAVSIAESKYFAEMHPKTLYDAAISIGFYVQTHGSRSGESHNMPVYN